MRVFVLTTLFSFQIAMIANQAWAEPETANTAVPAAESSTETASDTVAKSAPESKTEAAKELATENNASFKASAKSGIDSDTADIERASIAVPEMKARGVDEAMAQSLNDLVVQELSRIGIFKVISMSEILQMIEHDQIKTAMGCSDESCLAEIGGALGVDMLLSGSLSKIGQTYILNLKLIDVRDIKVVNREERTIKGDDEKLIEQTRMATRVLVQPLLEQASGWLNLTCSEEGAEVYIDEVLRGTTPLKKLKTPGGFHKVVVSKNGFVAYAKDLHIDKSQDLSVKVGLIPSSDFVEAYESKAQAFRTMAWTFGGLSMAALLGTTGLLAYDVMLAEQYKQDKASGAVTADESIIRSNTINSLATGALGLGVLVPVAAISSAVFWLFGDEPGKYADMLQEQ